VRASKIGDGWLNAELSIALDRLSSHSRTSCRDDDFVGDTAVDDDRCQLCMRRQHGGSKDSGKRLFPFLGSDRHFPSLPYSDTSRI